MTSSHQDPALQSGEIREMLLERRAKLDQPSDDPPWGLALSGGGIRSATFCFGLLRALAASGALLRFDIMSTVSGGGYIGAMLGRLLGRAGSVDKMRETVAVLGQGNTSWFAWWLRANGDYLLPRGAKDRVFALAVYVRNFVGIHVELAVVGLLLGAALALTDGGAWWMLDQLITKVSLHRGDEWLPVPEGTREIIHWMPTLWILLVPLGFASVISILAYWAVPLVTQPWRTFVAALVIYGFGALLWQLKALFLGDSAVHGYGARAVMWGVCVVIVLGWAFALPTVMLLYRRVIRRTHVAPVSHSPVTLKAMPQRFQQYLLDPRTVAAQDAARAQASRWLQGILALAIVVVVVGALDRFAWWLAFELGDWASTGILLAAIAAGLRVALPIIANLPAGRLGTDAGLLLGNVLGRVLTFCLFAWWIAVVHMTATASIFPGDSQHGPMLTAVFVPASVVLVFAFVYALLTGSNVEFLNLSSLHGFYRSRLVRSYLGATNPARFFGEGPVPPMGTATPVPVDPPKAEMKNVWEVDEGDDVPIRQYRPHQFGGPIHLLNVCLNETTSTTGKLFNRTRRGQLVTVGPRGLLRVGRQPWRTLLPGTGSLTLGSWMAISGAAVSAGLGRMTRGGISALTMFAGARLGFWWDSTALDRSGEQVVLRKRLLPKAIGVMRETLGNFGGDGDRDWYLSDGGHFENTGAYALLAERCKVIVVADCGADPDYRFGDLENLVRKARIDLAADIEFVRPRKVERPDDPPRPRTPEESLLACFGSLNDLASDRSKARYALARILYRDATPDGVRESQGFMVVVKPNLFAGLPVDLFNFKAEHSAFPQQSTADQFFNESQWESYCQLGKEMGEPLQADTLSALIAQAGTLFVNDDGTALDSAAAPALPAGGNTARSGSTEDDARLPTRLMGRTVTAVSLSVGAAAAAGVTAWQAIDAVRTSVAATTLAERQALKELTDLWAKLPRSQNGNTASAEAAQAVDQLAGALARVSDTLCPSGEAGWFNRSPLATDILQSARHTCSTQPRPSAACGWLLNASDPHAVGARATCLAGGSMVAQSQEATRPCTPYWGLDYATDAEPSCAHQSDPIAMARRSQQKEMEAAFSVVLRTETATLLSDAPIVKLPVSVPVVQPVDCGKVSIRPMVVGPEFTVEDSAPAERQKKTKSLVEEIEAHKAVWQTALGGSAIAETIDLAALAAMKRRPHPVADNVNRIRHNETAAVDCAQGLLKLAEQNGQPSDLLQRSWVVERATPLRPVPPGIVEVRLAMAASRRASEASAPPPTPTPCATCGRDTLVMAVVAAPSAGPADCQRVPAPPRKRRSAKVFEPGPTPLAANCSCTIPTVAPSSTAASSASLGATCGVPE